MTPLERTRQDEKETRERILKAEAAALLLLLLRRRKLAPGVIDPRDADNVARLLESYLYRDLLDVRSKARAAGLADLRRFFPEASGIGLASTVYDARRVQSITQRFGTLVRESAGKPGAPGALDMRLTTIGVTENAEAFNRERREAVLQIAGRAALVEVWDATLDKRTCEECLKLDGTRAPVGVGFPGGAVPGAVHPRCRCTSHFERL